MKFWKVALNILTTEFRGIVSGIILLILCTFRGRDFINVLDLIGNSFIRQAFEGEYPKLLRLFNDLWRRLQQNKFQVKTNATDGALIDSIPQNTSLSFGTEPEEEEYE